MASESHAHVQRRVLLLGASNLTLSLPLIVDMVRRSCESPVEIYSAHGLGRSYGNRSTVMGRSLPGILDSKLWAVVASQAPLPTTALITDIGNDVLYQVVPEQIAEWVAQCIDRLHDLGAHVSMTLLPVCNLEHLGPARFYLFRTLFFPMCRLSFESVCHRAERLNELLKQLADSRQVRFVDPVSDWYTFDAIHVAPRKWHDAWPAFLDPMFCHIRQDTRHVEASVATLPHTAAAALRAGWWMLKRPECRWLLGIEQHGRQPAVRYPDGSTVSFY